MSCLAHSHGDLKTGVYIKSQGLVDCSGLRHTVVGNAVNCLNGSVIKVSAFSAWNFGFQSWLSQPSNLKTDVLMLNQPDAFFFFVFCIPQLYLCDSPFWVRFLCM